MSAFLQQKIINPIMDFLLPPLCLNCDSPVAAHQSLCPDCWKQLHFIAPPFCACCGASFDLPVEAGTLCAACLDRLPSYDAARSVFMYDDVSKGLILRLKHADQLHPVPALAAWLIKVGGEFWGQADMMVPVPLHRWRLLKRRYNQAALLARAVARQIKIPVSYDVLQRIRATDSQGHKNRQERYDNLRGAFAVKNSAAVKGRKIVLIDDVLTTGATVDTCARLLKEAGAAQVFVVTLARTRLGS
ncbi:MAG: ComF family protein [Bdellovibrionales bacterium]